MSKLVERAFKTMEERLGNIGALFEEYTKGMVVCIPGKASAKKKKELYNQEDAFIKAVRAELQEAKLLLSDMKEDVCPSPPDEFGEFETGSPED